MNYFKKYQKYHKKYNDLKAGMLALKYRKPYESLEDRKTYEVRTESEKRLYLDSWCFNNDIKIIDANVLSMNETSISFKEKYLLINIPNEIEVEIKYDYGNSEIINKNIYKFSKYLSKGTYGSVFQYKKISNEPGLESVVCKVILSSEEEKSIINRILPELNAVSRIKDSTCKKIDSYILNLDKFYNKSSEKLNLENLKEYNIYYNEFFRKNIAVTIMPMADGDVYNNLYRLDLMNLDEKKNLFNYCINTLECMLNKHDLVYPDLKMEQLLFFKCPAPGGTFKYIYTIGDLGGFQKLEEEPIASYGPHPDMIFSYEINSMNLGVYPLAALWHDLYSNIQQKKILNLSWNKNLLFKHPFEYISHVVKQNLAEVVGLERQREVVKDILKSDPRKTNSKEKILDYLNKLKI